MNGEATTFVDTNILVYAYDVDAGDKHEVARQLVRGLWRSRRGVLSTQVLQEFYVTVTRKLTKHLDRSTARRVVRTYQAWPVQVVDVADILAAAELEERHQMSFWDALIVVAARRAGADRIMTEDLQAGRQLEGVTIENPFAP